MVAMMLYFFIRAIRWAGHRGESCEQWPDFGCEGIKVQRAHQPTSQCQGCFVLKEKFGLLLLKTVKLIFVFTHKQRFCWKCQNQKYQLCYYYQFCSSKNQYTEQISMRIAMMMSLWMTIAAGAAAKVVYKSTSLDSVDWEQIPKNDLLSYTWMLNRDGSMELLTHSRALTTCNNNTKKGFSGIMHATQIPGGRKLKQLFSEDVPDLQAIIDTDDRIRSPDTLRYPFSAVGLLMFRKAKSDGLGRCTGTMISPSALLTSAHCIWEFGQNQANKDFKFYPARDGNRLPFDEQDWANIFVPNEWTQESNPDFDYAVIQLLQPIGDIVGWLDFGYSCGPISPMETFYLLGYPSDKANQQWYVTCNVEAFDGCDDAVFFHTCDTLGGSSGGVLWKIVDGRSAQIQGVHQGYYGRLNKAIAINQDVFEFINRNV
eukprot:TRINITY_DN4777_c0_g1_i4.p1 TRINITY_DN4777_c0_g1~~TRINITY_DN4777_c0_g1_i4.p1  ORF type:complete len:428 (-),score=67.32 TRINITY_DN4777_c0_g1_i4:104-1387(-)